MSSDSEIDFDEQSNSVDDATLASVPFDQRLSLRKAADASAKLDSLRSKRSSSSSASNTRTAPKEASQSNVTALLQSNKKRRKLGDKNAPVELSAKVKVGRMGATVTGSHAKHEFRDPRFDPRCGVLHRDVSRGSYYFIAELEEREISQLRATLERAAAQDPDAANAFDEDQIAHMQSQLDDLVARRKERLRSVRESDQRYNVHKQEADAVANGKKPFYYSRKAIRTAVLQAEYKDLKKTGDAKRTTLNRARRSAARARKSMPHRRMQPDE